MGRAEKLLIAGTGMDSVHQTVALTNRAADIGYKAALVKTPSFFKGQFAKPETQMLFFRAVADQAKIPVMLYNFPQNTGVDLAAEAVAELSHHPNIIGIKESSGNVEKLLQMVRETKKGFQVLTGSATTLAPSLAIGCTGGILAFANPAPYATISIWEAHRTREPEAALDWQNRIGRAAKLVTTKYGIGGLKYAMDLTGYYGGPPRLAAHRSYARGKAGDRRGVRRFAGLVGADHVDLADHAQRVFADRAHESIARNVPIAEGVSDAARGVHDRAQAVFVEAFRRGICASALRAITRYQDQCLGHQGTQPPAFFGKRRADHRADGAVARFAHQFVDRVHSTRRRSFRRAAGRFRRAPDLQNPSIRDSKFSESRTALCRASRTHSTKGVRLSRPRYGVTVRASQSNPSAAQVRVRVGFGSRRNVVAFAVGDHQQAALPGRAHGVLKSLHSRHAVLLKECQLRLDGGNQIGHGINHQLMEFGDRGVVPIRAR